jgi:DNA-binding CsgD family transcriptional regulator/tetratricopeptide (TPR) repeat protein
MATHIQARASPFFRPPLCASPGAVDTEEVLLERETQLAALAGYAEEARQARGRLVFVAGEAGAGKSALVEQLQLDLPGGSWCWGACDGLATPRPLGPLFDIARELGGELLELCRTDAPREHLFGALLRQVSEAGELHVVVVEDLHWADEATTDLLRFLSRRIRDAPVLLIATYRDEGVGAGHPLQAVLGDLASHRSVRRVSMPMLSPRAVQVLVGDRGLDVSALYRLTGGNPFYVTEVVQSGMGEIPVSARDAVVARVSRLSAAARDVLDAAALIGGRVGFPLLESVTGCPAAAADELLAAGLLAGDSAGLRFRHEIARLAVQDTVAGHRRRLIHARILGALGDLGHDDDARLAFHAEAAGDGPAVLRYAPAAAHRAAGLGSHREAVAQFERALRFADGLDPAQAARLHDDLAGELAVLDRWQDAADARERALALWRATGDRLREGDSMRHLARALGNLCRGAEAVTMAETAVATLRPLGPSTELAWAYAHLAGRRMVSGDNQAAIGLAASAQAIAESLGLPEVLSSALNAEGCAAASLGRDWQRQLHRALDVAVSGGLHEMAGLSFTNICSTYGDRRQFAEAEQHYTVGVAYCDDHDITSYARCLRSDRIIVLERTGRWAESLALSTELLSRPSPSPINRLVPLCLTGVIRARHGEPGAWDYLDQAVSLADGTGEPQHIVPVRLARAEAFWLIQELDAAVHEAELAGEVADRGLAWDRGAVAAWLRRTGSGRVSPGRLPEPYQCQADGDHARAAQLWTQLGCRYEAALSLLDAADEGSLREALRIFTDLGATATAHLTRKKMRTLGIRSIPVGPRTATRAHPFGLTQREHEVLDLIVTGHSNAEIAGQLFISAKTVDHHVSAVLAKLGAPSRQAAAAMSRRSAIAK